MIDQQVHVLRHDDVAGNRKEIAAADLLQSIFEELDGRDRREVGSAAIIAEGEEVEVACVLISAQSGRHGACFPTQAANGAAWMGHNPSRENRK